MATPIRPKISEGGAPLRRSFARIEALLRPPQARGRPRNPAFRRQNGLSVRFFPFLAVTRACEKRFCFAPPPLSKRLTRTRRQRLGAARSRGKRLKTHLVRRVLCAYAQHHPVRVERRRFSIGALSSVPRFDAKRCKGGPRQAAREARRNRTTRPIKSPPLNRNFCFPKACGSASFFRASAATKTRA